MTIDDVDQRRLILLEEGHCLRDQALAFCASARAATPARRSGFGATSLTTVMQMVAERLRRHLVPEIAADVEVRDSRVKLLRALPRRSRGRAIGLAWRRTSPRKTDFESRRSGHRARSVNIGSADMKIAPKKAAAVDAFVVASQLIAASGRQ